MLRIEGLVVRYGQTPALRGVDLHVGEGQIVSLVGANGAGKTTTLLSIVGLVAAQSGVIEFEGDDIVGQRPENLLRRGIALVPEGRNVFGQLTVTENLLLGTSARSGRREARREVATCLERFPALGRRRDTPAGKLSGGEQQQLAISRAIISHPRLLLLDEPSLGLAPLIVSQVFDTVADLRATGTTVLLVEQNAVRAVQLADHSYLLQTGRVVLHGDAQTVLDHEDFVASYLGGRV